MKLTYLKPEIEIISVQVEQQMLAGPIVAKSTSVDFKVIDQTMTGTDPSINLLDGGVNNSGVFDSKRWGNSFDKNIGGGWK